MFQKERQDAILEILKNKGYVNVKYLTQKLQYSTATVNRDLNELERQKKIKRSYGGAELTEQKAIPLPYRYDKMRNEKRMIGHVAAEFVESGDTVFIDGTTTTQSMARYLTEKKDITVITNNMALVSFLSEYNISAICLGGFVQEAPSMLNGEQTVINARMYHADKMFFSSGSILLDGRIGASGYALLLDTMVKNSDKVFFLVDHDKIDVPVKKYLFDLEFVDYVISDYDFPMQTKTKFPKTQFIYAGKNGK